MKKKFQVLLCLANLVLLSGCSFGGSTNTGGGYTPAPASSQNGGAASSQTPTYTAQQKRDMWVKSMVETAQYNDNLKAFYNFNFDSDYVSGKTITNYQYFYYYDTEDYFALVNMTKTYAGAHWTSTMTSLISFVRVRFEIGNLAASAQATMITSYGPNGTDEQALDALTDCQFDSDGLMTSCTVKALSSNVASEDLAVVNEARQTPPQWYNHAPSWINTYCGDWGLPRPW
jgi:hypothetical protein